MRQTASIVATCLLTSLTLAAGRAAAQCAPVVVGTLPLAGSPNDCQVSGSYAYVTIQGNPGILEVIDISNPASPTSVAQFPMPNNGTARGLVLDGNLAYVAAQNRLEIVDISTPASPSSVASVPAVNDLYGVALNAAGTICVTAEWSNYQVIDVSTPASPSVITAQVAYGNTTKEVSIVGNTMFLGRYSPSHSEVSLYDISTPASPLFLANARFYQAWGIHIVKDSTLYMNGGGSGIVTYDVSNPVSPSLIGYSGSNHGIMYDMDFGDNGDVLYTATGRSFRVYDPSTPVPTWVAQLAWGVQFPEALDVQGSYAYVVDTGRVFSVVDVLSCVSDQAPTADAGPDFAVNEGQVGVVLDGNASSDPEGDPLTYAWRQIAGTPVALSDPAAAQPTFDAPLVAIGGETLTFELTVTANGASDVATVNVTVVNVNHPPVADAGDDQSIAEGSLVTLDGSDSFDVDGDAFTYAWVQTGGSPTVTLSGAGTANPTFTAPVVGGSGAPGIVATLTFDLTVDDGFPQDAPAPGYTFANVVDSVTVDVTNVNNDPTADAGADQTVDENTLVSLSGGASSDPDGDALTYAWSQTGGTPVALSGGTTATPSFTAPFTSPGGEDFTFQLTVDDGYGGIATDTVVVHAVNVNDPPFIGGAQPTTALLWPPNHKMVSIGITGVADPDNNATITIDGVTQDEPTNGTGDGDTPVDAIINADGTVLLRAERDGGGDGRVYHVHFTASDLEGSVSGTVTVSVPKKKKDTAGDGGGLHDSTQ